MKLHNGMRPQDIVILLKILLMKEKPWQYRDLATDLNISISEISSSISRSALAGLINPDTRKINRQSLMEFLEYGLKYVFPVVPGRFTTGIATSHSHPFYKNKIASQEDYVWPNEAGNTRGVAIEPLHANITAAITKDELLYRLLASVDVLRTGKTRERKMAVAELKHAVL